MSQLTPVEIGIAKRMAARQTVSLAEAEKLQRALDRLAPTPEPEVDEATLLTRRLFLLQYPTCTEAINGGKRDDNPSFMRVSGVLREVLAGKDAERNEYKLAVEEAHKHWHSTNAEWNAEIKLREAAESELAKVRAENERLRGVLAGYSKYISFDQLKAAERNPAEPEHRLSGEPAANAGEVVRSPSSRSSDGSGAIDQWGANEASRIEADPPAILDDERKAAFDVRVKSVGNLPVDGGFDGDLTKTSEWLWASLPVIRKWTGLETYEKALVCHLVSRIRTEAEARGRREALEEIVSIVEDHITDSRAEYYLGFLRDELKRLMTEGK